jgi:peptidoglycan/LPS O-acetylase OafA/YrhL
MAVLSASAGTMNRIATLDGWRGVAILFVLAEHLGQYGRFKDQMWTNLGSFGVDIFFVLSGYLITARLIEERKNSSTINLRRFYLRRAFRILPLVVIYLLALCLLSHFVALIHVRPSEIAGSLFFFRNYQFAAHPVGLYTTHFWSLSIEEHFYLLWPALLLWLDNRRALRLAVAGAVACATWRLYCFLHPFGRVAHLLPAAYPSVFMIRTDARIDGLLVGCALALLLDRSAIRAFVFRNFPKETPVIAGFFLCMDLKWTHGFPALTTYLLIALMCGSVLVVQEGVAFQWLNFPLLTWIGTVSYSVYVWQELFLLHPDNSLPLGRFGAFPYNLVCTFVVASCSFYLLERPAIALGRQVLQRRQQPVKMATELVQQ